MADNEKLIEAIRAFDPSFIFTSEEELERKMAIINSETRLIRSEVNTLRFEIQDCETAIKENKLKIKRNKTYPLLVGTYNEHVKDGKAIVMNTLRASYYLPVLGFVKSEEMKPGDLVALHKESNLIFNKIPRNYDERVKTMELETKPDETYEEIGGLERQIEELNEAIVMPLTHPEKFKTLGIKPPKGVLLYGPPGTGKTLMARACAAKTNATFLRLAGPQLVQMYIGEGARLVRDAFELARSKEPTIIFIDEIDAIGCKRSDSNETGDREVQRTMLEMLAQLDGFGSNDQVKLIAATNRADILDPALLRSGRLDMKIEFPLPNLEGRKRIFQIHARKMSVDDDVNFNELAKSSDGFNGAQCKAVCIEAGMVAMRRSAHLINNNDFMAGVEEVRARKKSKLDYFT